MNVSAPFPFTPCFMQVTKASSLYAGLPFPANMAPPMGAAGFDHNNPQPISMEILVWSWFDWTMTVKGMTSGIPITSLTTSNGSGETISQPPPNARTPFNAKLQIPQRNLQTFYDMYVKPKNTPAMIPIFVSAWNKGILLRQDWVAIGIV